MADSSFVIAGQGQQQPRKRVNSAYDLAKKVGSRRVKNDSDSTTKPKNPSTNGGGGGSGGASANDDMQALINRAYGLLDGSSAAVPNRTDAERRAQAESEVNADYDLLRLTAQQGYDRNDLALQQQRAGIADSYDTQREASAKQYADNYAKSDRELLKRGMQRSTYGAQVLANISNEGAEAQQALYTEQGKKEAEVDAQRTLASQQLSDTMNQYAQKQVADINKRTNELAQQDTANQINLMGVQNNTMTNLYNMLNSQKTSRGGGGKKPTGDTTDTDTTAGASSDWLSQLNGWFGNGSTNGGTSNNTGRFLGAAQSPAAYNPSTPSINAKQRAAITNVANTVNRRGGSR